MNTLTALRRALLLLMLCSGLFHTSFGTQRLRLFNNVSENRNDKSVNRQASEDCKKRGGSLVTVYDEEDAKFINSFTPESDGGSPVKKVWLGLHYVGNYNWSNGDPVIFHQTSEDIDVKEQKCEAIYDNIWKSFDCSEKKFFMCSRGNIYTLHRVNKTWCQALQHCRNEHSELVSIINSTQNDEVKSKGNGSSFWIGIQRDKWKWDDNGCSSFREWYQSFRGDPECTTVAVDGSPPSAILYNQRCDSTTQPFCVTGHVRIKVIQENKTWEQALNYCYENHSRPLWIKDKSDQEAVNQWLRHTGAAGSFWIGLRQSRVFGFWIWSDAMVVYEHWKDDKEPEPSMYNLCGVIDTEIGNRWREVDCLEQLPFICEEDIIYM